MRYEIEIDGEIRYVHYSVQPTYRVIAYLKETYDLIFENYKIYKYVSSI